MNIDIITISICAVVCGADGWEDIELYAGQTHLNVESKSNEITALPELINVLDLAGCIVTIDAMGCQREIVKKIVKKEADYVIAVKKNQPSLYERVEQLFKQAIKTRGESLKTYSFSTIEMNRGREETRNYLMISDITTSVTFQEDISRIRKDHAPANFAVLRHIAVNIMSQNKSRKLSVRKKRFLASLDEEYSHELLEAILA